MKFSFEELKTLLEAESKTLQDVIYHLWHNRTNPKQPFTFIDKIELVFSNHPSLMLGVSEDATGITVNRQSDDTEKLKQDLLQQFKGAIVLHHTSVADSPLWQDVIGQQIKSIECEKMSGGVYSNQAILISSETGKQIEIQYLDDGLVAEEFEK